MYLCTSCPACPVFHLTATSSVERPHLPNCRELSRKGQTSPLQINELLSLITLALSGHQSLECKTQLRSPVWSITLLAESTGMWLPWTLWREMKQSLDNWDHTQEKSTFCVLFTHYDELLISKWLLQWIAEENGLEHQGELGAWVLIYCMLQSFTIFICKRGILEAKAVLF